MDKIKMDLPAVRSRSTENSFLPCDLSSDSRARELIDRYSALIVFRPEHGGPVEAAAVPSEAERRALVDRHDHLKAALLPAALSTTDVSRVAAAVSSMLGGGYASLQNVDKRATIAGYTEALQDLPAWAVERGCEAVRKGKVTGLDPDWPPTHARMHQIAEKELAPVKTEQAQIDKVLALELPPKRDEAQSERVTAAAKAWLDRSDPVVRQLAEGPDADDRNTATAATLNRMATGAHDDIRKEWESIGLEPRGYSLSLARALGYVPQAMPADAGAGEV